MAQGAFEGGVVSIRGDASQVKKELSEVSKLLTELEKNKIKLKPEVDINNVKKDINKLEQYMQGRFGALDFSKTYSSLMKTASRNPNDFIKQLERTMHGVNLLDQAVKPEDISKLAAASAEEISELINGLGKLAPSTKATGTPVIKRLQALYEKYPNGIEGLGGSGKGGGFGASEEALNRIGDTLERIDTNVQNISESIRNGTSALADASKDVESFSGNIEKAEKATDSLSQKQQELRKALKNETVTADWDWSLQYLNGAKTSTPKKTSKPKVQTPESQPEIKTSTPDVAPIKKVVKAEEELRDAAEGATDALRKQNAEINATQSNEQKPSKKSKGDTFSDIQKTLNIPKEIKGYLKSPAYIARNLAGFEDSAIENLDWDTLVENIEKEAIANVEGKTLDEKLDRINGIVDGKKVNDPIDVYAKLKQAVAFIQQIQAMYSPEEADKLLSGFSILQDRVNNDWYEDIGDLFFNEATPDVDVWDVIIEKMHEWASQYNEKVSTLHEGLSQAEIESRKAEEEVRQEIMKGFTKEDVENANLGAKGTPALYDAKITETQNRLSKMSELKALLEQEKEQGKELSQIETDFLKNYSTYEANANQIILTANERKAALENPDLVRQANEEKRRQTEEARKITFSQDVMDAAHAQEELAKSVREANSALTEQTKITGNDSDNLMYHIGALSSQTDKRTHPFGQEMLQMTGLKKQGRTWGAGTGLYLTRKRSDIASDDTSSKNFYAINPDGLKMFRPETEEVATNFHNFIHKLEQFCIGMAAGVTEFDSVLNTTDNDQLYAEFQKIFPDYQLTFEQFNAFIDNMLTLVGESGLGREGIESPERLDAFRQQFGSDDIKTRFMKMLGFEGIDFKGTSYDDSIVGNVIFDKVNKDRIVSQGKNIEQVAQEAVQKTKQDAEEAKKNADDAKKAAEEGKKAVEQAKDNKEKTDAVIPASKSAPDLQPTVESAEQAKDDTEKQVMYVERSFDTLNNYLRQYTQELAQKKQERDALLQQIQSLQDGTFDTSQRMPGASATFDDAIEGSGQSKEDYLKGMLEHDTQQLDAIEQQIINKQAQIIRINKEHVEVEELVKQGYDVQEKQKPVKKNKKSIIIQVKDEIKAEEDDIKEAKKIIEEERQEAERLAAEKRAKDEVLQQMINDAGGSTKGHSKSSEFNFGAKLEGGETARQKQQKGGATIKGGNLPNYSTPGTRGGNGNTGVSGGAQQVKVVYQVETTLEDVKDANKQLKALKKTNTELTTSANQAADAIQKETEALSKMAETLTTIGEISSKVATANQEVKDITTKAVNQTLTPEQPQAPTKPVARPSVKPKATATKTSDEIKKTKEQIEQLQKAKDDAEQNLKNITLDDSLFNVGDKYQKRNAYTQVKQWADDLKKAQEEVNSLGKNPDPQKAQEVLDNYDKMRIGFSKAFEKAANVGTPANVQKQMEAFEEQYFNLGRPSDDFKQVEERFTQASTQAAERAKAQFEQQKQQAEATMAKLQARLEELQAKEKATPSTPEKTKPTTEPKPSKPIEEKPDLGGNQTGNGVQAEGDKAADAAAKMKELAAAKKEVTKANQNLAQSAQNTTGALNGEGGAGANAGKAFQDQIDTQKKALEEQKKIIEDQQKAINDLQKKQEEATNKKIENLQKEKDALTAQQQQDLQRYKDAELQTQMMLTLQKQAAEEEAKVREEQEAKAAQKAKEQAEKAAQKAQTKADDKELAKAYGDYGKDFNAVLNAKSIQEFDTAVAHLTETERIFWDARLKNMGDNYAPNSNIYAQNDLPADYKKSTEAQTKGLKQRQMEIAAFTASLITEAEKQQAVFEKMDTAYKTNMQNPTKGHLDFITSTKVDDKQARSYMSAVDGVTESLQKLQSVAESMKNGTFDFGDTNALRELLELRQTLDSQMSTLKVEDKGYKSAQSELETEANKTAEGLKKSLSGVADQIEGIQKKSKKLINPDQEYQGQLQASEQLLQVIKELIADINNNPLQFMDEGNVKGFRLLVDAMKEDVGDFQDKFDSQQGIQGRINTYFTSYKGAYTSFFREIKDSFKSQALGELQNEIDRTFKTFEESIVNLNRATGLNQGEFLDKYLNTNGGKASASQIEQQQKVRNAIAESYRGLITDISDELTKTQNKMTGIFGEKFFDKNYFDNFGKRFTAGLGNASEFEKFQGNAQKARDAFVELQKIQKQMADGKLDLTQLAPNELKERIKDIVELFAELNKNYQLATEKSKEFTFADAGDIEKQRAGITQFLKSNKGISSEARADLQAYFNQLQQGISQADLTKLTDGWHQVADAEQAAGRTGATFMSELQTRFRSLSAYLLSFVSFYRVIGVFKDGINIIHELDDALTEMQKVSDESLSSLREYQKGTFDTANQIGTTAAQLQQSTADWMRLGEDLQNASQSAQTANVLFNVSEFESIDEATTALVAMSAAYADAEKDIDKMDIVDRLNLIGNNYAIATDELATALQDGAATLQTAGNDLDEAIALTTAGNEKIA